MLYVGKFFRRQFFCAQRAWTLESFSGWDVWLLTPTKKIINWYGSLWLLYFHCSSGHFLLINFGLYVFLIFYSDFDLNIWYRYLLFNRFFYLFFLVGILCCVLVKRLWLWLLWQNYCVTHVCQFYYCDKTMEMEFTPVIKSTGQCRLRDSVAVLCESPITNPPTDKKNGPEKNIPSHDSGRRTSLSNSGSVQCHDSVQPVVTVLKVFLLLLYSAWASSPFTSFCLKC